MIESFQDADRNVVGAIYVERTVYGMHLAFCLRLDALNAALNSAYTKVWIPYLSTTRKSMP
jgi:hypothetical protein